MLKSLYAHIHAQGYQAYNVGELAGKALSRSSRITSRGCRTIHKAIVIHVVFYFPTHKFMHGDLETRPHRQIFLGSERIVSPIIETDPSVDYLN